MHRQIQAACRSKKAKQQAKVKPLYDQLLNHAVALITTAFDFKENLELTAITDSALCRGVDKAMKAGRAMKSKNVKTPRLIAPHAERLPLAA